MIWSGGLDFLANETYVYVPEIHQAQMVEIMDLLV